MGNVGDWSDLCPQTIIWQPLTGRDDFGKPIYGTAVPFQGRRVFKFSRVASYERGTKGQGAEAISESQIWILGTPGVKYEDLVYVAGDDVTQLPPVLSVTNTPDEDGPLFVKVFLGSSNG